ncbi:DUF1631 domain-containing protein [Aquabacterium sp. OR-4]|uniref:DUF1631 domain-containing protein n=1 Tax=Aquabacterium sp. OR-4 TaxID=2978127 RepID=UPI0021B23595|nr:DUF1631 domain-containing protein [Aquabacterium sp. OR-4]MDT7837431.1 DUF1631 domain-containing protein [Aquabacterium sp. OR-4]
MATAADNAQIASLARRRYVEELLKGLPALVTAVSSGARELLDKPAEYAVGQRRRDLVQGLIKCSGAWHAAMASGLRHVLQHGVTASVPSDAPLGGRGGGLSLVDDDTIEREILTSRLALAVMDRASWEFTDLRSRVAYLERRGELDTHDMLRAHILARVALDAWRQSGLLAGDWREAQPLLHDEFSALAQEAYHETNRWLVSQRVMADVDLRPLIRRTRDSNGGGGGGGGSGFGAQGQAPRSTSGVPSTSSGHGGMAHAHASGAGGYYGSAHSGYPSHAGHADAGAYDGGWESAGERDSRRNARYADPSHGPSDDRQVGEETRMMTRAAPLARGSDHAEAVMSRLNRLVGRHLPGFSDTVQARPVSDTLAVAIQNAQQNLRRRFVATPPSGAAGLAGRRSGSGAPGGAMAPTGPMLLDELDKGKQALKQAASSPTERATIEIVAMMFQSILTEDRIPAAMRVWFARLQMPVLRVAISEPDFFATLDHPARRLIDRMGACVMGLDSASGAVGDALEKEIKRVVQVVEAYPDTGRRVFQTVLVEFEKFLEHYFKNENEATRRGVSLAQQVEQRETLAIQYTIELRRMLNEVPVQEGVRQFLFQVWADVLATSAVRYGAQSTETKAMKRAAADLIWSASAKVTREERAEVIRRLPPLLKRLRDGMASANMAAEKQDERINALNNALAAAFTAKAAVIPSDRLQDLMERLDSLEELLPAAEDIEIDESMVLDLSGHESSELEVVSDGGTMPTAPMLAWARELMVGSWYTLDWRGRRENVQLVWHGMRRQLSLFVTPAGRCLMFQQQRLAAYLQAGLLLPAQDEALTVKATRSALARLDADPSKLMN